MLCKMHFCSKNPIFFIIIIPFLIDCFLNRCPSTATAITTTTTVYRRLLHQPLFPVDSSHPPATLPEPPFPAPQPQPQALPKQPFSSTSPPVTPENPNPFFPFYLSPPPPPVSPPPPPPSSALVSFPANISSLILPRSSSSSDKAISHKLIAVIISASILFAVVIVGVVFFFLRHQRRRFYYQKQQHAQPPASKTDKVCLFPPNAASSDITNTGRKLPSRPPPPPPPPKLSRHHATSSSTEFLYLGTVVSSREVIYEESETPQSPKSNISTIPSVSPSLHFHRLGSPELQPLPPLPRPHQFQQEHQTQEMISDDDGEEYFSPRGSTGEKNSLDERNEAHSQRTFEVEEDARISSSNSYHYSISHSLAHSSPSSPSVVLNLSPKSSMRSVSPDSIANFPARPLCIPPPPARESPEFRSSPPTSVDTRNSPSRVSDFSGTNLESPCESLNFSGRFGVGIGGLTASPPPPPPPPPPPRFWDTPELSKGPPVLVAPSRPVLGQTADNGFLKNGENEEGRNVKPKLKPLHWDKVRASSDRAMVWDQLKSSSFQLNEEMIETLFTANSSNPNPKDNVRRPLVPTQNQENQVLDPKKSQNIAILLRALNVTIEEVCDALSEGNADMLGTELLECLLKMAPTKEEERKLMEFKDETPFKLGPAEKFLKAVLGIPDAFRRVNAMLYIVNFDSEVEYLNRSFETLEEACKELRSSRMFMKLLEAVLKTGNRMNVGTNRGDAHAFKLDTLLKLVDVKGTDGRTSFLHFVVQEIIKAEGSRLAGANSDNIAEIDHQLALQKEIEHRKIGLQVVSGLIGELSNVKKAASMDSDALHHDVEKLASGIDKVSEILKLNKDLTSTDVNKKFTESMEGFLQKAEETIILIQAQERVALSMVRELTEYFHGNLAKEEAHPFRIFMVVKDFLSILDQVCKDVGKMNERTLMNSSRQFQTALNPSHPQVFPGFNGGQQNSSDDEDDHVDEPSS